MSVIRARGSLFVSFPNQKRQSFLISVWLIIQPAKNVDVILQMRLLICLKSRKISLRRSSFDQNERSMISSDRESQMDDQQSSAGGVGSGSICEGKAVSAGSGDSQQETVGDKH